MTDAQLQDREVNQHPDIAAPTFPIPEVPDWGSQVDKASEACRLIDRHLDFEARGRVLPHLEDFRPQHLCPEQRVQMVSDLYAAVH